MMLTAIPPRLLHRVRAAAAYVHDMAQLGLALLCPCEGDHGAGARWLTADETGQALEPIPDEAPPVHRFANGTTCWCGREHWRGMDPCTCLVPGWMHDQPCELHPELTR